VNVEAQINDLVRTFISQVSDLARKAAMETLTGALAGAGAARPLAVRPRVTVGPVAPMERTAGRRLAPGGKRASGDIEYLMKQFFAHVKANPGQRIEQINKVLRTKTIELRLPIAKLLESKAVRTKGQRRATTYFAT
jgi:hypothetical protein